MKAHKKMKIAEVLKISGKEKLVLAKLTSPVAFM